MVVNLSGSSQSLLQAGQNKKNTQAAFTQSQSISFKSTEGQNSDQIDLTDQYKQQLEQLKTNKVKLEPFKAAWEGVIKPLEDTLAFLKDKPIPFVATGAVLLAAFSFVPLAASVVCGAFGLYNMKEGVDNSIDAYKAAKNNDNATANKSIKKASTDFFTGLLSLLPAAWGINQVKHTNRAIQAAEKGLEYVKSAPAIAGAAASGSSEAAANAAVNTLDPVKLTNAQKALAYMQLRTDYASLKALSEAKTPTDFVLAVTRYHKPVQTKQEIKPDPNMSADAQNLERMAINAVKTVENPVEAATSTIKAAVAKNTGKAGAADVAVNEKDD